VTNSGRLATANQTLKRVTGRWQRACRHAHDHDHANDTWFHSRPSTDQPHAHVDRNVERTADVQVEAARTLDEMRELMKSLRFLIDTLQQQPEALLQGKPEPKEKK
jgi:hypothetical protein